MAAVIALRRAGLWITTVATGPVTSTVNSASDTPAPLIRTTPCDDADLSGDDAVPGWRRRTSPPTTPYLGRDAARPGPRRRTPGRPDAARRSGDHNRAGP
ncbi:hypothetical protein ACWD5Z_14850 [Micromonospora chokoriensis]